MSTKIMDSEELCEDAVFKVCDARENYSIECVKELDECLRLENQLAMKPVSLRSTSPTLDIRPICDVQRSRILELTKTSARTCDTNGNDEVMLKTMLKKIRNLKAVVKQIDENKIHEKNISN